MPNKDTPPKHKTPNYRYVPTHYMQDEPTDKPYPVVWAWEPTPLRSGRKDLTTVERTPILKKDIGQDDRGRYIHLGTRTGRFVSGSLAFA